MQLPRPHDRSKPERGYCVRSPERYNHLPYLANMNAIEQFTGLNFFSSLHPDDQELIERVTAFELWPE